MLCVSRVLPAVCDVCYACIVMCVRCMYCVGCMWCVVCVLCVAQGVLCISYVVGTAVCLVRY